MERHLAVRRCNKCLISSRPWVTKSKVAVAPNVGAMRPPISCQRVTTESVITGSSARLADGHPNGRSGTAPRVKQMPKGPRGESRPADLIGNAVRVMRIATGEEPDDREDAPPPSPAQQLGKLGGAARARNLTAEQRKEIARKGAAKRWAKVNPPQS
jgi:hypothetical protein